MPQQKAVDQIFSCPSRIGLNLGCAIVSLAGSVCSLIYARSGEYTIQFGLLIKLSPGQSHIFFYALAVCSLGIGIAFAAFSGVRLHSPQSVVLSVDGFYAPKTPWSTQNSFIRYSDVKSVSLASIQNRPVLNIFHQGGRQKIPVSAFESRQVFQSFQAAFAQRMASVSRSATRT